VHSATVHSLQTEAQFNQSGQLSNCQDGCQTNSRSYDHRVDISNTYRMIVLV